MKTLSFCWRPFIQQRTLSVILFNLLLLLNLSVIPYASAQEPLTVYAVGGDSFQSTAKNKAVKKLFAKIFPVDSAELAIITPTSSPQVNKVMRQIKKYLEYRELSIGNFFQIQAGLTSQSINEIYASIQQDFNVDRNRLDEQTVAQHLKHARQLQHLILLATIDNIDNLPQMQDYLRQKIAYFSLPTVKSSVSFVNLPTTPTKIIINKQLFNQTLITLSAGAYQYTLEADNYYPISGHFNLTDNEVKQLTPPLILKSENPLPIIINSNLSLELHPYVERVLFSYGWQQQLDSLVKFNITYESNSKSVDTTKRQYQMNYTYSVTQEPINILDEGIIKQWTYEDNITLNKQDNTSLERESRVLLIKSLLRFLATFSAEDYQQITNAQNN